MLSCFDIRAEFEDHSYLDFQVSAESLADAKPRAQGIIRSKRQLPFSTQFDWRGAVVFVDHSPKV